MTWRSLTEPRSSNWTAKYQFKLSSFCSSLQKKEIKSSKIGLRNWIDFSLDISPCYIFMTFYPVAIDNFSFLKNITVFFKENKTLLYKCVQLYQNQIMLPLS